MNWSWLQIVLKVIAQVPVVVQAIEMIHGNAVAGADKKTLAMQSLGVANIVANANLPNQQEAINAATNLASSLIDNTVAVMKAAKDAPDTHLQTPIDQGQQQPVQAAPPSPAPPPTTPTT